MPMRCLLVLSILCLGAACGLAEDDRDEQLKNSYPVFYDKQFEAYCLERFDFDNNRRISRYEMRRVVEIDCSDRGVVSLTDLREFPNLRRLSCARNLLTTLDLRVCRALERADCSENRLESLQIDELRGLTDLVCRVNRIVSLDLTTNGSLRRVDCRDNALTTLDVSHCSLAMSGGVDARGCAALRTIYTAAGQQFGALLYDGTVSVEER